MVILRRIKNTKLLIGYKEHIIKIPFLNHTEEIITNRNIYMDNKMIDRIAHLGINIIENPSHLNTQRLLNHYKTERNKFYNMLNSYDSNLNEVQQEIDKYLNMIKIELNNREHIN